MSAASRILTNMSPMNDDQFGTTFEHEFTTDAQTQLSAGDNLSGMAAGITAIIAFAGIIFLVYTVVKTVLVLLIYPFTLLAGGIRNSRSKLVGRSGMWEQGSFQLSQRVQYALDKFF